MDLTAIHHKLETMSEQITKVRESTARTEAVLAETLRNHDYITEQVQEITEQQNKWKGAMIVISALFSVAATLITRVLMK